MAYDEGLAERIRESLQEYEDVDEKKMFGGLCFMVFGHMCCGIVDDTLMARVGPENYEACLTRSNVRKMDFTGKPMKGLVYVDPEGIDSDEELADWLNLCTEFLETLPPK